MGQGNTSLYSPAFQVSLLEPYLQAISGIGPLELYVFSPPGDIILDSAKFYGVRTHGKTTVQRHSVLRHFSPV